MFHILLFLLNMIFRIELKGALSELVWSHVFFAEFICSLVLNSQKQFLWYLMLDNFNSMLHLFPLLVFFLFSFSFLLPFLPSPPSLSWLLLLRFCKMVGISFCVVSFFGGYTHWFCFDIPSFITCRYNDKNRKSYIWQKLSVVYLVVFFCSVVCLILVWVIFVSVVWKYVS